MSSIRLTIHAARTLAATCLACLVWTVVPAAVQDDPAPAPGPTPQALDELPPGVEVDFRGTLRYDAESEVSVIDGPVTIVWRNVRFQADHMRFWDQRWVEAVGNVLVVWGNNRIAGTSMLYDTESDEGTITDAVGQVDPEYEFTAKEARKVGEDLVYLKKASVTTCTQPVPYWSFRVSRAKVRVDGYAKLRNPRLRAWKVPFFWLPWMAWPIKEERAAGVLIPELHSDAARGTNIIIPVFIPIGRSVDVTVTGSYYTKAGMGWGSEVRFRPNENGRGWFNGFYINDQVAAAQGKDPNRYRMTYQQTQTFRNGFRMVADLNFVSDIDYFSDYERDLTLTSTPNVLTRLEFSRNGRTTSMNARLLRNERLFSANSSLVQQTMPEIELRGRSVQIGKTPLYFAYEASAASIQQVETTDADLGNAVIFDADYQRYDLFPTLSIPLSPWPFLDISTTATYRYTYYSQSQGFVETEPGLVFPVALDEPITRALGGIAVNLAGPKAYRVWQTPDSKFSRSLKHTFEPFATYRYDQGYTRGNEILKYDEVDLFGVAGNSISYGLRNRLFAKRPRSTPTTYQESIASIVMPEGMTSQAAPENLPVGADATRFPEAEDPAAPDEPKQDDEEVLEPLDIMSLDLFQTYSFNVPLSLADLDGDGVAESDSNFSAVTLAGRYNPSPRFSLDLRSSYQILYKKIRDASLSGSLLDPKGRLRFSLVHRAGLGVRSEVVRDENGDIVLDPDGNPVITFVPRDDSTQLALGGGVILFGGKVQVDLAGSYNFNPSEGNSHIPEYKWRVVYSTQCCTFLVERLDRSFTGATQRQDWYFRVDLRGIGKILSQRF